MFLLSVISIQGHCSPLQGPGQARPLQQGPAKHDFCSEGLPTHAVPPHMATSLVLLLCLVPVPQYAEQLLHDCQLFHEQSTEMLILKYYTTF